MMTTLQQAHQSWLDACSPSEDLLPSQWAEKYRIISSEATGRTMAWRNDVVPYMVEIMDTFHASCPSEMTVVRKPVQVGASETMNTVMGWVAHQEKKSMLMVQPTIETSETYSDLRIKTMIRDSPALASIISENSRDETNRKLLKVFPGGFMKMAGANSSASLKSLPVPYLFCDEVDEWPSDCNGQGAPFNLAKKRTDRFVDHKIWLSSTPTFKESSVICHYYDRSSQGRYHVPCHHCGTYQPLEWEFLVHEDREYPAYECQACNYLIEEAHKYDMLINGHWVHQYPDNWIIRGYFLNGLYSPVGWFNTWGNMVLEYRDAQAELKQKRTKGGWIVFQNNRLAHTISLEDLQENEPDVEGIRERCEDFPDMLPERVKLLTCGVDVQGDRLEYESMAWGPGKENWSWKWGSIVGSPGSTLSQTVWTTLDAVLGETFVREDQSVLTITMTLIDSGGHHTNEVYAYAQRRARRGVLACKGYNVHGKPLLTKGHDKHRRILWLIGTETAKDTVFSHLNIIEPGPGYCHFPKRPEYDEEYFRQLFAEEAKWVKRDGRLVKKYIPLRKRNEKLDLRVMNYAAAALADHRGMILALPKEAQPKSEGEPMQEHVNPFAFSKQRRKPRAGFVNRFKNW